MMLPGFFDLKISKIVHKIRDKLLGKRGEVRLALQYNMAIEFYIGKWCQ